MLDALRRACEAEPDIAFALLFGSMARGTGHGESDADVAVQLRSGAPRDVQALGSLGARLSSAAGRAVDLVLLDEAKPSLAYRIFRDGRLLVSHDDSALIARKVRVLLDYLDFKPVEERCAASILRGAAARGR